MRDRFDDVEAEEHLRVSDGRDAAYTELLLRRAVRRAVREVRYLRLRGERDDPSDRRAGGDPLPPVRTAWLHGAVRSGAVVLSGTSTLCVGCGRFTGTFAAVLEDDWEPLPTPAWPFDEGDCPVCELSAERGHAPAWPRGKPRPLP